MGGLIFLVLMVAAGWLLLVRPQQQRLRAQRALISSLSVGQQVVTAGGMVGTIVRLDERDVGLEVAPGVVLTFLRPAISRQLNPNELDGGVAGDGETAAFEDAAEVGGVEEAEGMTGAGGAGSAGGAAPGEAPGGSAGEPGESGESGAGTAGTAGTADTETEEGAQ